MRVKKSVNVPRYKWGSVTHASVGTVTNFSANGKDVTVDFPQQSHWTGLVCEMELVPYPHNGVMCNCCQVIFTWMVLSIILSILIYHRCF